MKATEIELCLEIPVLSLLMAIKTVVMQRIPKSQICEDEFTSVIINPLIITRKKYITAHIHFDP